MELQQALFLRRYQELKEAIIHELEIKAAKKACQQLRNMYNIREVAEPKKDNTVIEKNKGSVPKIFEFLRIKQ